MASFRATPAFCKLLCDNGSMPNTKEKTTRWIAQDPAQIAESMGKHESAKLLRELSVAMNAVRFGAKLKLGGKKKEDEKGSPRGTKSPRATKPKESPRKA